MHNIIRIEKSNAPLNSSWNMTLSKNEFLFLQADEIECLVGKKHKKTQIEALRKMGIHFYINACGSPVVPRPQFFGKTIEVVETWKPRVLLGK